MSEKEIQNWLVARVSEETGIPTEQIAPKDSLLNFDLDSLSQLTLVHDLEIMLDIEIDPEIIVFEDTISKLAAWLIQQK